MPDWNTYTMLIVRRHTEALLVRAFASMMISPSSSLSSSYGTLQGDLFRYTATGLVAFESPPSSSSLSSSNKKCILLGGLSDGLIPVPYTQMLHEACIDCQGWTLVQPILSSSYTGFGHGSLDRDVEELNLLIEYLLTQRTVEQDQQQEQKSTLSLCIIGHSTGCQQIIHYLRNGKPELIEMIQYAVLQGPVSDREASCIPYGEEVATPSSINKRKNEILSYIHHATMLIDSNKGDEMMPRHVFWAPITAKRFYDLHARGGLDDYFSSDYTDDELSSKLQHVGLLSPGLKSCLVVWPGCDEYVPSHVNGKQQLQRLVDAMNSRINTDINIDVAKGLFLEYGNHNLSSNVNDCHLFINEIKNMLQRQA